MIKAIMSFTNDLRHTFKKDEILEILDLNLATISSELIPMLEDTSKKFQDLDIKIEDINQLKRFNEITKFDARTGKELVDKLLELFSGVLKMGSELQNMVSKQLPDVITKENLTVKEAGLLNFITHINFITVFTFDFILLIIAKDAENKKLDVPEDYMSKRKLLNVNSLLYNYATLVGFYYHNLKNVLKNLQKVPDVQVELDDKKVGLLQAMFKKFKVDRFIPISNNFIGNPIYHIRLWLVDREVEKYESLKDKKRLIELKLLNLEQQKAQEGSNPKVEKQIEYYEEKLQKVEYKIKEIEEE